MGRSRFVEMEAPVRLPLSDGDFIDVKRQLTAGEERHIFAQMARDIVPGQRATLIPEQVGRAKVLEYLLGWSFTDKAGAPVPVSPDAVDQLDIESFNEVLRAVDAHEERESDARAREKNDRDGASKSAVISPSVA